MSYRIGEFAELSGVSAKTLRFYDEIGLLQPAMVDPRTGYRRYLAEQLPAMAMIRALRELGMPLPEIRRVVLEKLSGTERTALLMKLRSEIEDSVERAKRSLALIDGALLESQGVGLAVTVKRRAAMRVASVRSKVTEYCDIIPLERELWAALPQDAVGDTRGVLWHSCADSGVLDGEPFVVLNREVPRRSYYEVKEIPAARVACAYSGDEDEAAEQAYREIRRWMAVRGYRLAGAKREIYREGMLEIQFPVEEA